MYVVVVNLFYYTVLVKKSYTENANTRNDNKKITILLKILRRAMIGKTETGMRQSQIRSVESNEG